MQRRILNEIHSDDSQLFRDGYARGREDAARALDGPQKLFIQLPKNLHMPPSPALFNSAPIYCSKVSDAVSDANRRTVASSGAPAVASREKFAELIGCSSLPVPCNGPDCDQFAFAFIPQPRCYVSAVWSSWYVLHLRRIGAMGGADDGCIEATLPRLLPMPSPGPSPR